MINWKCKKCAQINTKHNVICQHCGEFRGFWSWYFDKRNLLAWIMIVLLLNMLLSLINLIFIHNDFISYLVINVVIAGLSIDAGYILSKIDYFN